MLPIWLAEAGLFTGGAFLSQALPTEGITLFENVASVASLVLLPALAGHLLHKAKIGRRRAVLGAMSISLVSLVCAFISLRLQGSGWLQAYLGYLISVVVFALPAQALSGFVAASLSAKMSHET
jgi:hypothetical protein